MAATSTAKKSKTASGGMPIEDYDRLSVKAILPRLTELSAAELQSVVAYEKAGKNRVTLLQGVRKVELAREAAAPPRAPESHLTVVEDLDDIRDLEAPVVVAQPAPPTPDRIGAAARPAAVRGPRARGKSRSKAKSKAKGPTPVSLPAADIDLEHDLDLDLEVDFETDIDFETESEPASVAALENKPPRPPVKAATWEEEPRLQLPRRLESSSYDLAFEPSPVALVPPIPDAPSSSTASTPRVSGPAKVRRKFEGAVLVMAAVLAILLGLAIGTILARSGTVSAEPVRPTVSTQTAAVQAGG